MNQATYLTICKNIFEIAEENGVRLYELTTIIRTTSGRVIKAFAEDINADNKDFLEIYTDDKYIYLPYTNIESLEY